MLSVLRGSNPPRRNSAGTNPVYYEDGEAIQEFHGGGTGYFLTHTIPNKSSMFNPPLHLHLWQREFFRVTRGRGIWYQPTRNPAFQRVVKAAGDTPIELPPGKFHRFEHDGGPEPLVVDIGLDPETNGAAMEESFFRNFFGYLEDCRVEKTQPSLFQIQLFLYTVDGPLAIPVPGPDALKFWVSRVFMWLTGVVVGEMLLGYRRSYVEYYRPQTAVRS